MGFLIDGHFPSQVKVIEPQPFTLAGAPSFLQIERNTFAERRQHIVLRVVSIPALFNSPSFQLIEQEYVGEDTEDGNVHEFRGTTFPNEVGGNVFFMGSTAPVAAQNIANALRSDAWIAARYDITVPLVKTGASTGNRYASGQEVHLRAKFASADFMGVRLFFPRGNAGFIGSTASPLNLYFDPLSIGFPTTEIEVEVHQARSGGNTTIPHFPSEHIATLSKTYTGAPIWFDANGLFPHTPQNPQKGTGWFDSGTFKVVRLLARVRAINSFDFYVTDPLTILNGGLSTTEDPDLSPYISVPLNPFRLLTRKPATSYVRGQNEFINFICRLADNTGTRRVRYEAFDHANRQIGEHFAHDLQQSRLRAVNTCKLDLDAVLDLFPNAAIVRVGIVRGTQERSNLQEYRVERSCFFKRNDFTFLNALGGWDSFNFGADSIAEARPAVISHKKTVTLAFSFDGTNEAVHDSVLSTTYTVEGLPVNDETAEWLKELAASKAIFDKEGRNVIVEDFTLRAIDSNFQIPVLKYRFSQW